MISMLQNAAKERMVTLLVRSRDDWKQRALANPRRSTAGETGQMTVELAVAFPVMIIVAVIATNALLFFSDCAAFDRLACEAVRVYAAAPAYGASAGQACAQVQQELATSFSRNNLSVSVESAPCGFDYMQFVATLDCAPTLFGMGLRSEVLGVSLPHLRHTVTYVVDPYRPGVVI